MGMFDLFSKDGRDQRARDKNIAAAVNKYKQSPDRMKAMQALRDDGSPEALYGLIRRFGMMYDKTIEDEQEKEWVFEMLVGKGGVVLELLKVGRHAARPSAHERREHDDHDQQRGRVRNVDAERVGDLDRGDGSRRQQRPDDQRANALPHARAERGRLR